MRKKKIKIPIYECKLILILVKDLSYVEKKYKTRSLKNYAAVTIPDENKLGNYIVAFECKDRGIIAHEIVHLINYIFIDHGVELDRHNDETQSYLTSWLFNKIEKFIYK